jgi:FAD/FMN-containing dehydrogenase/Fe-S oxidoreductase
MAHEPRTPTDRDPATDRRATYDYRSDRVDHPDLEAALEERVDGEVRTDSYSRELYATDASIYEETPIAVVFPTSTADVSAVVSYCADEGVPVLPRGGGTSLAGQAVNEAVVLDTTRHMDAVLEVSPGERRARAQSGVTLAELNDRLADHDLKFAPDPAWGDKSVLGGAVGNNSTGAHSLQYGKTDAYLERVEVVLADGTVTEFGEVPLDELDELADTEGDLEDRIYAAVRDVLEEHGDAIEERYPELKRNVSGYNLDWLVEDLRGSERGTGEPDGSGDSVNLAKLLAGSEGTLAVVTEAEVALEPVPETKGMTLLTYEDLGDAMADVATLLEFDPAAVELVDDVLIDLASERPEFRPVVERLPEGTAATLLVEFYAESDADGRRKVAELLADRVPDVEAADDPPEDARTTDEPVRAFDAVEAHDADEQAEVWKLRKAGLPILLSRTTDDKHVAFIEDTAIPPENLPEYVADFQEILDEHDTFASFYAHAGPGVLHIRPLVNTKTVEGVETMESIADAVTDLVVEYDGSVSGEHGDGRARTQWNRKLYGDELWSAFQELKSAFDPDWLLNPGQVVARPADPADMTDHLRFDPDYGFDAGFEPALEWDENGMQGMVELCHGCGGCRGPQETTGGVMCPTFRASEEEITSTRGRANALRQAMSGDLPDDVTDEQFMTEVLDLCIGCKGCKHDCPSGVDMAKLKAEVTHAHHQEHGTTLRDRVFAEVDRLTWLGSAFAPLSNVATSLPGSGFISEKVVGIARERDLPSFRRTTVHDWFDARGASQVDADDADRRALLLVDSYTNYAHPEVGRAAVEVLEAAGVHVELTDTTDSGRPAHSRGMLDHSGATAADNVAELAPSIEDGWDVVCVEPSDAVMLQSDYRDLLGDDADPVPDSAYGVCEYLDVFDLDGAVEWTGTDEHLTYHGHCHQKATAKDHHAVGVLRRAGYEVDPLDSGCCGMAGSFGYEAEHFEMSKAIGRILFDQVDDSPGETVVAPGTSCRTQLGDREGTEAEPPHPVEKLAELV